VNNRDLIIKKNKEEENKKEYDSILLSAKKKLDKRAFVLSLALVIPSFFLSHLFLNIALPLLAIINSWSVEKESLDLLGKLFAKEKKSIDTLRNYPLYFSSRKELEELINEEERNDFQDGGDIKKEVEQIEIKDLSFSYNDEKKVFEKLNMKFIKGEVNFLKGKNGFGKSTLINLIFGLLKPESGNIIINNSIDLKDIDLKA
jgi:ABC-type multidrug transport system fused ATPase/permease subunit